MMVEHRCAAVLVAAAVAIACGGEDATRDGAPAVEVTPALPGEPYDSLAEWNLFADGVRQEPAARVVPYDVISPLFSDFTTKHRFMWIPEGTTIVYDGQARWGFPVGTILVKTFGYLDDEREPAGGRRLLETRLLVRETDSTWRAHTYVWDEAQSEAVRKVAGATIDVSWVDREGAGRTNAYAVPNTNQCQDCHGEGSEMNTLGGRTRQLDRDNDFGGEIINQLELLFSLGMFDASPEPSENRARLVDPFGSAPMIDRVRSYLDSNCGHCHAPERHASSSALWIDYAFTDPSSGNPTDWGVCKFPTSAGGATCGLTFDVVPGDPDASIMVCRMASEDPQVRMPPVASKLAHPDGVSLIREWIAGMSPFGCQ